MSVVYVHRKSAEAPLKLTIPVVTTDCVGGVVAKMVKIAVVLKDGTQIGACIFETIKLLPCKQTQKFIFFNVICIQRSKLKLHENIILFEILCVFGTIYWLERDRFCF